VVDWLTSEIDHETTDDRMTTPSSCLHGNSRGNRRRPLELEKRHGAEAYPRPVKPTPTGRRALSARLTVTFRITAAAVG